MSESSSPRVVLLFPRLFRRVVLFLVIYYSISWGFRAYRAGFDFSEPSRIFHVGWLDLFFVGFYFFAMIRQPRALSLSEEGIVSENWFGDKETIRFSEIAAYDSGPKCLRFKLTTKELHFILYRNLYDRGGMDELQSMFEAGYESYKAAKGLPREAG